MNLTACSRVKLASFGYAGLVALFTSIIQTSLAKHINNFPQLRMSFIEIELLHIFVRGTEF